MSSFQVLSKQGYKRLTWKNGLGHTDEIGIYPEGAELKRADFLWRLSSARIEQASPFSVFPRHDRVLVVLKGAGVRLTHTFEQGGDEESTDVYPLNPYEFPGDVPSRCELLDGPITDLSVFVRKAEAEALVDTTEVAEGESFEWMPSGRWNFAFAVEGDFDIESPLTQQATHLTAGDTLSVQLDEPLADDQAIRLSPVNGAGKLLIVGLQGEG